MKMSEPSSQITSTWCVGLFFICYIVILTTLKVIENDPDVGNRYPIPTDTMQLFDECKDGLILCKLINDSVADTIDTRVLNKPQPRKPLNAFQITENNNIVITSAKGIGCSVVNIGSSDISEGREHLILGLIWQVIRRGLLAQVDIKLHPELYRLCEDGETIDDLLRLTPDQILLRWFNYHLKAAGWKRRSVFSCLLPYGAIMTSYLFIESTTLAATFQTVKTTPSYSTN